MSLGFNSQLQLGDELYHVQTEDRGSTHPFIDTVVFSDGQVVHRSSKSYQDLLGDGAPDQELLRARVEQQHRNILEELRSGVLPIEKAVSLKVSSLEMQLCNSKSWLVAGRVSLDIQVRDRGNGRPFAGATVEVSVEGAASKTSFESQTDDDGRALVSFPLPPLAEPDSAALVIEARFGPMYDRLRYHLKPKTSGPASQ